MRGKGVVKVRDREGCTVTGSVVTREEVRSGEGMHVGNSAYPPSLVFVQKRPRPKEPRSLPSCKTHKGVEFVTLPPHSQMRLETLLTRSQPRATASLLPSQGRTASEEGRSRQPRSLPPVPGEAHRPGLLGRALRTRRDLCGLRSTELPTGLVCGGWRRRRQSLGGGPADGGRLMRDWWRDHAQRLPAECRRPRAGPRLG